MIVYIAMAVLIYFVVSFVLTTQYVKHAKNTKLCLMIRKNFYFFPVIPLIFLINAFRSITKWPIAKTWLLMRVCFEKLSGKRTYIRKRISYYYYGR